jgi:Ca-activated chloride channel family protein
MFRFANPEYLWLFLAIPFVIILFWMWRLNRKKKLQSFADNQLLDVLIKDDSKYKPFIKLILSILIMSSLIIALAGPQIGSKLEKVKRSGIEIMFVLDVSNSMLAEDIQPNRLERAKQIIVRMLDNLQQDKVGLIIFAGNSFLQVPLTTDYSAVRMLLPIIGPDMIGLQGTALGKSIDLARVSFSEDKTVKKAIIIISDGENHEDDAVGAAKVAAENGIKIYTIGMGSPSGAPIPLSNAGNDFLKDKDGQVVISKMSPEMLTEIATTGKGKFVMGSQRFSDISQILNDLSGLQKKQFDEMVYTDYDDKFYYFLWAALVLIIIDVFISEKRNPFLSKLKLFKGE